MINEQLREFGLSDKEIGVYLALLELGSASAQEVSRTSELNRSTTYIILGSLLERGLINKIEKNDIRIYEPMRPESLLQKTTELIDKYSKIEKDVEAIIPDLHNLSKKLRNRPRVIFFEGTEGTKSILDDTLSSKKDSMIRTFSKSSVSKNGQFNNYDCLQKKMLEFSSNLIIYENKVILISTQNEYGVIIENENIANTMKELFDLAQEEANKIDRLS